VEHQLEVAGALVDSKAVKHLAEAIEAHTREAGAQRTDAEKSRQLGYRLVEAINHFTGEVFDLRQESATRRWKSPASGDPRAAAARPHKQAL
jgi:hypothetical protein